MAKAQLIGHKIHRIEYDVKNKALTNLIHGFLLQFIQEPIILSANGFFDINFGCLKSVKRNCFAY